MTPEEKFNKDVWWTLQAIKGEQLSTLKGKNVEVDAVRLTNIDADSPAIDNVSKCIRKLEEWGAFKVVSKYEPYGDLYETNADWSRADIFVLAVNQPKFDRFYRSYEESFKRGGSRATSNLTATEYIKNLKVLAETPVWLDKIKKEGGLKTNKEIQSQPNNQILTAADKKKLCVLEKLKEEENLTPKIPVKRHISFGYSYIRPANEANLSEQKLITWIKECGLSDVNELENILSIFQQNGLISKFNFSEQERVLKMQFPENFEKRSSEYTAGILSIQKPAKTETQQQEKNGNDNDKDVIKVQTKAGLLIFNKDTGYAKLEKFEAKENINPQSQETKVLLKLMTGKNHQATYEDLLGENPSKTNKRNLGFVIRNLKEILGILPKKKAQNKNCIKNIKGYGYKLIT